MFALTALMSLLWFVAGPLAFGSSGVEQGPFIGDLGNIFLAKVGMDRSAIDSRNPVRRISTRCGHHPRVDRWGICGAMRFPDAGVQFALLVMFMHPSVIGYGAADVRYYGIGICGCRNITVVAAPYGQCLWLRRGFCRLPLPPTTR